MQMLPSHTYSPRSMRGAEECGAFLQRLLALVLGIKNGGGEAWHANTGFIPYSGNAAPPIIQELNLYGRSIIIREITCRIC
jgi:hypothetical protein